MRRNYAGIIILILLIAGCSSNPADVSIKKDSDEPFHSVQPERVLLSMWNIRFDPESSSVELLPVRGMESHFDVTSKLLPPACEDCIKIELSEFDPASKEIEILVTLRNSSEITVFDARAVLFTSGMNVTALEPDSYTGLWSPDDEINPFYVFGKEWPNRKIVPGSEHVRAIKLLYSSLHELGEIKFAVDISWPGNCHEPYEISSAHTTGSFVDHQTSSIWCQVLDWQDDVAWVTVDLSCLGLDENIPMSPKSDNWWAVEDIGWVDGGNDPGLYQARISAESENTSGRIHQFVPITLEWSPPSVKYAHSWDAREASSVAFDSAGNIFVAGDFKGDVDFDPGDGVEELSSCDSRWIYILKLSPDGEFQWVRAIEILYGATWVDCIEIDKDDNILLMGTLIGNADFDTGPGVVEYAPSVPGGYKEFLVKYTHDCHLIWYNVWPGEADSFISGSDGEIYVRGFFTGTIDFDPGPGTNETSSNGSYDAFIEKFNSDGDFQWVKTWGGPGADYATDITLDDFNNILVSGCFSGTVDFDPGVENDLQTSIGALDAFYSRFSTEGEFKSVKCWGGTLDDLALGIVCESTTNIIVLGEFSGWSDIGSHVVESMGGTDVFISKFSPSGFPVWSHRIGGLKDDKPTAIEIDSMDKIIAAGSFESTEIVISGTSEFQFDLKGILDAFMVEINTDGEIINAKGWGSTDVVMLRDMALKDDLYCVMSGWFRGKANFDSSPYISPIVSSSTQNSFLVNYITE